MAKNLAPKRGFSGSHYLTSSLEFQKDRPLLKIFFLNCKQLIQSCYTYAADSMGLFVLLVSHAIIFESQTISTEVLARKPILT